MSDSKIQNFLDNKLVKSFIAYSIFRAFYGFGILIVTYFIDKNTIIEILTGFKRAGANAVVTYFANKIAKDLKK